MNFLQRFLMALPILPAVIVGIEQIHTAAGSGAAKKDLALASLGLAQGVADAELPEYKAQIDEATKVASNMIDSVVSMFNIAGWPGGQPAKALQGRTVVPAAKSPVAAVQPPQVPKDI